MAETENSRIIEAQYTAPAAPCSVPARSAVAISWGLNKAASTAPKPWLSEFATSSLGDCARQTVVVWAMGNSLLRLHCGRARKLTFSAVPAAPLSEKRRSAPQE